MVSGCPVPGPGVTQGRGHIGLARDNWVEEMVRDVGSYWVGLHMKDVLKASCLLSLEISYSPGRDSLSRICKPPRCQSILKYRIENLKT